jgi:hypothetical protein
VVSTSIRKIYLHNDCTLAEVVGVVGIEPTFAEAAVPLHETIRKANHNSFAVIPVRRSAAPSNQPRFTTKLNCKLNKNKLHASAEA